MSSLSLPFLQTALATGLLAGTALAVLGAFVVMRRVSFTGLAVSQLAALGAVVGTLLAAHGHGHDHGPGHGHEHAGSLLWALACVAAGMAALSALSRRRARLPADSWVAWLYVLGASAAVLILSKSPGGESHTMSLLFGNVLTLGWGDAAEAGVLLLGVLAVLTPWFWRWLWLSFDPLSAEVAGTRTGLWDFLFSCVFAAAMTLAIHYFGVLLAFAYLILPACAARLAARGLKGFLLALPLTAWAATALGVELSFRFDLPTGPATAGLLALAVLAAALRPKPG